MRAPLSWLREFVPIDTDPDELATRLSLTGIKVEEVIRVGSGISGVVVGEVRAVREHPNADNLMLVRAFDGTAERDIVCGARNYVVGDRVPLAMPGAKLPNGMEIARREVRGEQSDGMLCSARELEISDDHSGILILDLDAPVGKELVPALELDDVVFDFDITGNRPDALSVMGIAREISILYKLPFTVPEPSVDDTGPDVATLATVQIDDARGCPRYLARVIVNISLGRSPWWMRRRLYACGMRPISNVVDITNYVLLERGHPLHAFDLDTLSGNTIVVRRPRKGERITTLDGQERALKKEDLLICDAERPVAIAGVMGGAETEVSDRTTRILLESAFFNQDRIAHTSRRLGLRSEASVRFEHGADVQNVPPAATRAAQLLVDLAGGTVARGTLDVYPKPVGRKPIRVRVHRVNMLLGTEQSSAELASILGSLGCNVDATKTLLRVTAPSWRPDIQIEENVVEEIARLYGYDKIPERLPGGGRVGGLTLRQRQRRVARTALLGAGLNEAETLSLLPPWFAERAGLPDDHPLRPHIRLANPLSEDESVLRPSLVPGLLLAAQRNAAHRSLPVRLFELGIVFTPDTDGVKETERIAFVVTGSAPATWDRPQRELDFFDAKGALEALLAELGAGPLTLESVSTEPLGHPGRCARVLIDDREAGTLMELRPSAADALELPGRVAVCELDAAVVFAAATESTAIVPPRFPPVARDIALIVPEAVAAAGVEERVRVATGDLLDSISLFDVYRGEPLAPGTKSLAFSLLLRHPDRTLTDGDADGVMRAISQAAADRGWSIRE